MIDRLHSVVLVIFHLEPIKGAAPALGPQGRSPHGFINSFSPVALAQRCALANYSKVCSYQCRPAKVGLVALVYSSVVFAANIPRAATKPYGREGLTAPWP
jgi:hypothetical protein